MFSLQWKNQQLGSLKSSTESQQFDVNDVSILYPISARADGLSRLSPDQLIPPRFGKKSQAHKWVIGGGWDKIYLRLTANDFNGERNASLDDRAIFNEPDFKSIICEVIRNTSARIKGVTHLTGDLEYTRAPNSFGDLEKYCGFAIPKGTLENAVPELTDIDLSFGDVIRSETWRVVGVRFDPCTYPTKKLSEIFDSATRPVGVYKGLPEVVQSLCRPTVRVVVQPLSYSGLDAGPGNASTALDFAMHMIFELEPQRMIEVVERLNAIKRWCEKEGFKTSGEPLDVRPCFGVQPIDRDLLANTPLKE
jgi:hypothetical protein